MNHNILLLSYPEKDKNSHILVAVTWEHIKLLYGLIALNELYEFK
jgi:hypothetical protein